MLLSVFKTFIGENAQVDIVGSDTRKSYLL